LSGYKESCNEFTAVVMT